jgi:hypothetical protein
MRDNETNEQFAARMRAKRTTPVEVPEQPGMAGRA